MEMWRRSFLKTTGLAAGALISPTTSTSEAGVSADAFQRTLRLALNKPWFTLTDPSNNGTLRGWSRAVPAGAVPTRVPSILQEVFPGFHGAVWYWISFQVPQTQFRDGQSVLLFHAVDYYAEVWLNGARIGDHEGGETPFVLDATNAMKAGEINLLAVRVLNPTPGGIDGFRLGETAHSNKTEPYATGNGYDFGGILEPVELLLTPAARIANLHILPDWQLGLVRVRIGANSRLNRATSATLTLTVGGGPAMQESVERSVRLTIPAGLSTHEYDVKVKDHCLWDIDDPCCYELRAHLSLGHQGEDTACSRFGFRDFRLVNGYFYLNQRRIFVKSTHTGSHVPFSQTLPPPGFPDILRIDMVYAKAAGFNMVRFIAGVARPSELDLCDTLGLLVYEESHASWLLKDSPHMQERYQSSVREMVLRDRNHPCLAIWGMLNETEDGPVFREAVESLALVREHDPDRLVLLSSGRFDGDLQIGSACNPGETTWQYVWGREGPQAGRTKMQFPSGEGSGDFHYYPPVPQTAESKRLLRTLGEGERPVFLSEYGIGSMMHVLYESRKYEQAGIRADAEDNVLMHSMAAKFLADWDRFGMEDVYPYPETLLEESERAMAKHRQLGFDLIRSNPNIAGFNLTGMLDHGMTGEGLWRFWRDWKPTIFDAVRDGWSPVRWCLFAGPAHVYSGESVKLEAVLAHECGVRPGTYDAEFRIMGQNGPQWKYNTSFQIADRTGFVTPVLDYTLPVPWSEGAYQLTPSIPVGIATPYRSQTFYISERNKLSRLDGVNMTTWGVPATLTRFLEQRGAQVRDLVADGSQQRECIVVGTPGASATEQQWSDLLRRIAQGDTAIFLSPAAFAVEKDTSRRFPARKKGRIYAFYDWLYHKECVAKSCPLFEGLQGKGLLEWDYFGPTLPRILFDGFEVKPDGVFAAAFAAGYTAPGGYASGILLAHMPFFNGGFVINSFQIAENLGFPVADRMLLNAVLYGSNKARGAKLPPPDNFENILVELGYRT
jgi:hypothetical protein